jgi:hypothetical protein
VAVDASGPIDYKAAMRPRWRTSILLALLACTVAGGICAASERSRWRQTRWIPAPDANQAAAADERFIYGIGSTLAIRYDRATGQRLAVTSEKVEHLNSGFMWQGRLYCANSNYPKMPEESQLMVLDPETMELSVFKDFGRYGGSLTWAIHHDGHWWCCFAHYGANNARTFLAKFDQQWNEIGRWTFPPELIPRLGRYSVSGGIWRDDLLVVTGHDDLILFRLRLPKQGTVLELVDEQPAPFTGQGIAHDPVTGGLIGINRGKRQIVLAELE